VGVTRRIQRLPDDLVNKIAAGEVVERPASVVRELVENALDAGARSVNVEIEGGGKRLVRVRDDGRGMDREDAVLSVERHATSKLSTFEDLGRVATLGFRGEALPSIASVSQFLLRTSDGGGAGTEVEVRHGTLAGVRDAGHPRGTTVEVRDLFGAVPARRKFLRADGTEAAHVAEAVTLLALAHPGVGFFLTSGGRRTLEAPGAEGLEARVFQLLGSRSLEDLVAVAGSAEWARVEGFVSRIEEADRPRAALRLFVNRRPVRDRALSKAVLEAYRAAGARAASPEAILFVEVPPHLVDVNVHPAKREVRFADGRIAFHAVEVAVRAALSSGARSQAARVDRIAESAGRYLASPPRPVAETRRGTTGGSSGILRGAEPLFDSGPLTVLGQHRNTYIVASDGEDLLLVDQHTAHERVRFEGIVEGIRRRAAEAQRLLAPIVVTLPPALRVVLDREAAALAALGFEVEAFGGTSMQVRAVPAALGPRDAGSALQALLQDVLDRDDGEWWGETESGDRLAATLACHTAVRAGDRLGTEAMTAILRDLERAAHPALCPHGRPTRVRIPREDVARWFERTGWRRQ
jgi:DNA mismatch repair protein MutL